VGKFEKEGRWKVTANYEALEAYILKEHFLWSLFRAGEANTKSNCDYHSFGLKNYKGRNFRGQKPLRFSRSLVIFAKVYAFENSKSSKRKHSVSPPGGTLKHTMAKVSSSSPPSLHDLKEERVHGGGSIIGGGGWGGTWFQLQISRFSSIFSRYSSRFCKFSSRTKTKKRKGPHFLRMDWGATF